MAFDIEELTPEQQEQFCSETNPDPLSPTLGIIQAKGVDYRCGKRRVFICNRRA